MHMRITKDIEDTRSREVRKFNAQSFQKPLVSKTSKVNCQVLFTLYCFEGGEIGFHHQSEMLFLMNVAVTQ